MSDNRNDDLTTTVLLLKQSVDSLAGKFESYMREDKEEKEQTRKLLFGNGEKTGLIIKIDRLEGAEKRRDRSFWLGVTTFVGLLVKVIYDWISQKGSTP